MKRSFTKWLSGSKANAELPSPPEKKSASDFFEGVWNNSERSEAIAHEVGNYRKTSEASFACRIKNRQSAN